MSEENNNVLNFNDALGALDSISGELFTADVWVPSIKKFIKVKELNAKQQKTIIESAIDSANSNLTFSKIFFKILIENCIEDPNTVKNFSIIDKASIAISMRKQISETIKVQLSEDPLVEKYFPLGDISKKFEGLQHPEMETITVEKDLNKIEVDFCIPTVEIESELESSIYKKPKNNDEVEDIKQLITNAFLGETAKHIKEIRFNGSSLDYYKLNTVQKITFVEKLPTNLVQKILEKIVVYKEVLDKTLTVSSEDKEKVLEIGSLLFLTN